MNTIFVVVYVKFFLYGFGINECYKVDVNIAHDVALSACVSNTHACLVEHARLDRRLWKCETPAQIGRLSVNVITT